MLRILIETMPTWATLPLRIGLGLVFIAHGAQKVFGLWGGPGSRHSPRGRPRSASPRRGSARLGGFAELIGGTLVLLGLLTPRRADDHSISSSR